MLDRRSLILGLAAALMLPAIDAFAASKDKDKAKDKDKGGNGGGNNGGSNNGGGNNGGSNNGGGNNGGTNNGKAGGAAKSNTNGNATGAANGNANANANPNSSVPGNQSAALALEAVENGKAMPLRDIQALIEPQYPGVLIEAQLQRRGSLFYYDLTVLSPQGRVYVVTVEAATGLVAGR